MAERHTYCTRRNLQEQPQRSYDGEFSPAGAPGPFRFPWEGEALSRDSSAAPPWRRGATTARATDPFPTLAKGGPGGVGRGPWIVGVHRRCHAPSWVSMA